MFYKVLPKVLKSAGTHVLEAVSQTSEKIPPLTKPMTFGRTSIKVVKLVSFVPADYSNLCTSNLVQVVLPGALSVARKIFHLEESWASSWQAMSQAASLVEQEEQVGVVEPVTIPLPIACLSSLVLMGLSD